MEDKGCFGDVGSVDSSQFCLWADKNLELAQVVKNHPVLPGRKENRKFVCVFASFQWPLALNNSYVRVQVLG